MSDLEKFYFDFPRQQTLFRLCRLPVWHPSRCHHLPCSCLGFVKLAMAYSIFFRLMCYLIKLSCDSFHPHFCKYHTASMLPKCFLSNLKLPKAWIESSEH